MTISLLLASNSKEKLDWAVILIVSYLSGIRSGTKRIEAGQKKKRSRAVRRQVRSQFYGAGQV